MPRNKYGNKPVTYYGHRFASRREGFRYLFLRSEERAGRIAELELQPRYRLEVNGVHVCDYIADFKYWHGSECRYIVEDAKGVRTELYKLKAKLMLACHGIEIKEV